MVFEPLLLLLCLLPQLQDLLLRMCLHIYALGEGLQRSFVGRHLQACQKCYRGREHDAGPAYGQVMASSGRQWTSVVVAHGVVREVMYPDAWSRRVNTYSALHGSIRRIHCDTEVQNRAQYTVQSKGAKRKLYSKNAQNYD